MMCGVMGAIPEVCTTPGSMTVTSCTVRFLMGLGGSMVEVAASGTLPHVFKEDRGKVMAANETVVGLG
eukprot:7224483-Prymnesium_polylepis.1